MIPSSGRVNFWICIHDILLRLALRTEQNRRASPVKCQGGSFCIGRTSVHNVPPRPVNPDARTNQTVGPAFGFKNLSHHTSDRKRGSEIRISLHEIAIIMKQVVVIGCINQGGRGYVVAFRNRNCGFKYIIPVFFHTDRVFPVRDGTDPGHIRSPAGVEGKERSGSMEAGPHFK